ncbi:MAG: ABC-2 family transporter protein [Verrucomicrobiales bacterium]|nr:ABC-2 family transporter protein [Verrucomicrobiales bacterium]
MNPPDSVPVAVPPAPTAPAAGWRRYASIYAAFLRNALVREMGFKINFILWIFVELLWFGLQLAFMAVIYRHTERIASWTQWQVVLLVGSNHFIQQIFTALFMNNCVKLSENVRTGMLDFLLLMPVNARFLISLRHVDFGAFVNAGSALAVMYYAARQLHLSPSAGQWAGFALLLLVGLSVHYSVMYILACISFWTVRAQGIVWGYYNLFHIARLPDEAFRGLFRGVFTFVIPVLLVTNVPVKLLVEKLSSPLEILWLLGLSAAFFAASEVFWRWSVRHYASASS